MFGNIIDVLFLILFTNVYVTATLLQKKYRSSMKHGGFKREWKDAQTWLKLDTFHM